MGKFYLEQDIPEHISEIAEYFLKEYAEHGTMSFSFQLNYGGGNVAFTANSKSKTFPYSGNPMESMVSLGFGTINYIGLNRKNEGHFTISSELLKWHDYKNASPAKKKWIRLQENILENKVYISIIISIIALMISIFR